MSLPPVGARVVLAALLAVAAPAALAPAADQLPVPFDQHLVATSAGNVPVQVNGIAAFGGTGEGTVEVSLASAPAKKAHKKPVPLGKGSATLGDAPATVSVKLTARGLKEIRHRTSLRVQI